MYQYTDFCFAQSKILTKRYSTSFYLATKLLDKDVQKHIYAIYGMVRVADELVDTFKPTSSLKTLDEFEKQTYLACKSKLSLNPVLHAFAQTYSLYHIEQNLVKVFFQSMRMDVTRITYSQKEYEKYIYGSAEAVGLMCLSVFVGGNQNKYKQLLPGAKALGSAFQKVNFLRDIRADNKQLGRMYFPSLNFDSFSQFDKQAIELEITKEFKEAKQVIGKLPRTSRYGVYLAYCYYKTLLKAISRSDVSDIKTSRIRVPNFRKVLLFIYVYLLKLLHI